MKLGQEADKGQRMLMKIRNELLEQKLLKKGDGIVVGVSGGADSVCLLCVLAELRQEFALTLYAVHVHHGIRGKEADRDVDFTKEVCQKLDVLCKVIYQDVPYLAKQKKCSEEEMGRKVRYQALEECRKQFGCRWIAVAHNQEDNAETVLWNLCRGSGLAGLTGIRFARGHILRPLLHCNRAEIEQWLEKQGQNFCTDRTNLEETYTRNRIRHQVLPLLTEQINSQSIRHIAETAERLARIQVYLEEQIEKRLEQVQEEKLDSSDSSFLRMTWEKKDYEACPEELRQEAVLELLRRISGQAKDIVASHVKAVMGLYGKEVGKEIHLPYAVTARRTYTGICLEKDVLQEKRKIEKEQKERIKEKQETKKEQKEETEEKQEKKKKQEKTGEKRETKREQEKKQQEKEYKLEFNEQGYSEIFLKETGERVYFWIREKGKEEEIIKFPESSCTKWFDYDKITNRIVIRTRKPGDWLTIHPDGRRKKLKDYWIDRKLPKEERDKKWLLAADSEILWIFGERTGERCRVEEETKKVLIVQIKPES